MLLLPRTLLLKPPTIPISLIHAARQNRTMASTSTSTSTQPQPVFSSTYDPAQAAAELAPLLRGSGGRWTVIESGKGVERGFRFRTFKKTWVSCGGFILYGVSGYRWGGFPHIYDRELV